MYADSRDAMKVAIILEKKSKGKLHRENRRVHNALLTFAENKNQRKTDKLDVFEKNIIPPVKED